MDLDHPKADVQKRDACWLIKAITGEALLPSRCPDARGLPWTPGKKPDYEFVPGNGELIVVEATRLITRPHRELKHLTLELIAKPLERSLVGSYVISVDVDRITDGARLRGMASEVVQASLTKSMRGRPLPDKFEPCPGIKFETVPEGHGVYEPQLLFRDLPPVIPDDDPRMQALRDEFFRILNETSQKFAAYDSARRVLLVNIGESGLDCEYHVLWFRDPSPVSRWLSTLPSAELPDFEIYLGSGVGVWRDGGTRYGWDPQRIVTGTKYVDEPHLYARLLPEPVCLV